MPNISEFAKTSKNTLNIDWDKVEKSIGYTLHENTKDFFSRITAKKVNGRVNFVEKDFVIPTNNERNDNWFSFNDCEGMTNYSLYPATSIKNIADFIKKAIEAWTGGNNFGHRIYIGDLYMNIGEILILLNNDTGNIEWIDCSYGYYDVYEENPNGIFANNIQEFLDKLQK